MSATAAPGRRQALCSNRSTHVPRPRYGAKSAGSEPGRAGEDGATRAATKATTNGSLRMIRPIIGVSGDRLKRSGQGAQPRPAAPAEGEGHRPGLSFPGRRHVQDPVEGRLAEPGPAAGTAGLLVPGWFARRGRSGLPRSAELAAQEGDDLGSNPIQGGTAVVQHLGPHALPLSHQAEEDVLGSDVVVTELEGLTERELQDLLGPGRERDLP